MEAQLLVELNNFIPIHQQIVENVNGNGGNIFVEGILATTEKINGNGRYYSRELWEREIAKFQKKIEARSTETCGELDHPESSIINLQNSGHAIRKLWWDGDRVMGRIEIFSEVDGPNTKGNPIGRITASYLRNNLTIGISSRGMGSLKQVGEVMEVQDDFQLLTWDFVSNPSNPNSWMKQSTSLNESQIPTFNKYNKVQSIITEILCSNGNCPIF